MAEAGFTFGPFELDVAAGTLLRGGVPVPIPYRALQVLAALLQRAGDVVSKAELLDAAWPGLAVEEGNLTTQVAVLRKLLGEDASSNDMIATVPRVGYRFVAAVAPRKVAQAQTLSAAGPSIAVLPFANLGPDLEQQYFAEGLAEDIITRLSRFPWLMVSARNSSFTYQARAVDVKQVGRELGVRYVLGGSVRRSGGSLRATAQLNAADTGAQVWAERYDLSLDDFFALQDEIAVSVLAAIEPELYRAEGERARSQPPKSLNAWGYVMQAMPLIWTWGSPAEVHSAQNLLDAAIRLEPGYAKALSLLAWTHAAQAHMGKNDPDASLQLAASLATTALQADPLDSWSHFALGYVNMVSRNFAPAIEALNETLRLTPSLALAHLITGSTCGYNGMAEEGLAHLRKATRLSPRDYNQAAAFSTMGLCHLMRAEYAEATALQRKAVQLRPHFVSAWRTYAAAAGLAGLLEEGRAALKEVCKLQPSLSIAWVERFHPIVKPEDRNRYCEGLAACGLE